MKQFCSYRVSSNNKGSTCKSKLTITNRRYSFISTLTTMSRTMKPVELVSALAFVCHPDEFTKPDSCNRKGDEGECDTDNDCVNNNVGPIHTIARVFKKAFSESHLTSSVTSVASCNSTSNTSNAMKNKKTRSLRDPGTSTGGGGSIDGGIGKDCRFGTVEVRKYPITIGQNPAVSSGIPLTMEWDLLQNETEKCGIDQYERDHPAEFRKRGNDLVLDGLTRATMLKELGYSKEQLLEGLKQVDDVKQRHASSAGYQASSLAQARCSIALSRQKKGTK